MKTIAQQLNIKQFPFIIKDKNGNNLYYENSNGYWAKREYDELGQEIYYEDSSGHIINNRPKPKPEYTMAQLVEMLGEDFKLIK